jgi:hypothetical protein
MWVGMRSCPNLFLFVSASLLAGCMGNIGDSDPRSPSSTVDDTNPFDEEGRCTSGVPSPGLARLTRRQYARSIEALLDQSPDISGFPVDEDSSGIGFGVAASLSPLVVEQYAHAAEQVASRAVGDLPSLLPCDPTDAGEEE